MTEQDELYVLNKTDSVETPRQPWPWPPLWAVVMVLIATTWAIGCACGFGA